MAARGARVTGVDLSPRMLEHARRREAAEPLGIECDVVTSCLALRDVPRPDLALRAVHAVLRPGGRAVCR